MDMQEFLNGLEHLLEDRATGDFKNHLTGQFVTDNYEVVIAGSSVRQGTMYITVAAKDGTIKHFRLTEI